MGIRFSENEQLARLRLSRSRGIGPLTFIQLTQRFGSGEAALDALPSLIEESGRKNIAIASAASAEKEAARLQDAGGRFLFLGEEGYPAPLSNIADPPPVLALLGESALLSREAVAIVGARNASAAGRAFARQLGEELGRAGRLVVSGMARGIDAAAHGAALQTGTAAVLAGGVNSIYPPEHGELHAAIAAQGVVISEQPLGMTAKARDFPKRNRIVSGLCRGVVVVEAAERSGTLITARLAAEQGRDVFAVPGSPLDPRASGTNALLRRGAILCRNGDDVLDEWSGSGAFAEPVEPYDPPAEGPVDRQRLRDQVLELLSFTPTHKDQVIAETDAPAAEVAMVLLDLVLEGEAAEEPGGTYVLAASSGSGSGAGA